MNISKSNEPTVTKFGTRKLHEIAICLAKVASKKLHTVKFENSTKLGQKFAVFSGKALKTLNINSVPTAAFELPL